MNLYEKITSIYPELTIDDFGHRGTILLQNDSDRSEEHTSELQSH